MIDLPKIKNENIYKQLKSLVNKRTFAFYAILLNLSKLDSEDILKIMNFEIAFKTDLLIKEGKQNILFEYLDKLKELYYDNYLFEKTNINITYFEIDKEQVNQIIEKLWHLN